MKYFTVGNSREILPAKIARRSKWFADLKISGYDLFAIAVNQGFIITKTCSFQNISFTVDFSCRYENKVTDAIVVTFVDVTFPACYLRTHATDPASCLTIFI